jgi:conjugal transfer pilus assembly protein TraF
MHLFLIIFTLCARCCGHALEPSQKPWQERHAEGWAWYHNFKNPQEKKIAEEPPTDPIELLTNVKKEVERALAQAILDPTKENVLAYMLLQKKWILQSAHFSKIWQKNILEHPEVASLLPTTQYGVQAKKENDTIIKTKFIQNISKSHLLLFFYEGGNVFSKIFTEVVFDFAKQYQWEVKAISVDGITLSVFPESIKDNSIAEEMNVHYFPSLFAVDIVSRKATPLAFGMASIGQIEENIAMQFEVNLND